MKKTPSCFRFFSGWPSFFLQAVVSISFLSMSAPSVSICNGHTFQRIDLAEKQDYFEKLNHLLWKNTPSAENFANDFWSVLDQGSVSRDHKNSFFSKLSINTEYQGMKLKTTKTLERENRKAGREVRQFLNGNHKAWDSKSSPEMSRFLDENQVALDYLAKSACKQFFVQPYVSDGPPKLIRTSLPGILEMKEVSELLTQRSLRSLNRRDLENAVNDAVAGYRIAGYLSKRRTALEMHQGHLAGTKSLKAIGQLISDRNLNKRQLLQIKKCLTHVQLDRQVKWHFQNSSRWMLLDVAQNVGTPGDPMRETWPIFYRKIKIDFPTAKRSIDSWFDQLVSLDRHQNFNELKTKANIIVDRLQKLNSRPENDEAADPKIIGNSIGQIIVRSLLPNFLILYRQQFRIRQHQRILSVAIQLRLKKLEDNGFEIDGSQLNKLNPDSTKKLIDPFCGNPIRIRKSGKTMRVFQGSGSSETFRIKIPW